MSAPMNTDEFKNSFKYFKRRKPPPDLSGVIDFRLFESEKLVQQVQVNEAETSPCMCANYGLKPLQDWKAFSLIGLPGFIFIQDPFLPGSQRFWIKRCLKDFPRKPNICNLDAHMSLSKDDSLWDMAQTKSSAASSKTSGVEKSLLQQLRWVTFGYHHNWDTKVYQEDHHSPFPSDLAGMTELIASAFGYGTYKAQAAIVNYYHLDSTLGGHTDHSEFDLGIPIISYSFGQSAIFLLGGQTKEQKPTPMYLHSGDIIIMGGPSRLAYHAVPRVLPSKDGSLPQCLEHIPETLEKQEREDVPLSSSVGSRCAVCIRQVVSARSLGMDGIHESAVNMENTSSQTCSSGTTTSDRMNEDDLEHPVKATNSDESDITLLGKKRSIELDNEISLEGTRTLVGAKIICKEKRNCTASDCPKTSNESEKSSIFSDKNETSKEGQDTFSINSELNQLCCNENWDPFVHYLRDSRINVSVRQVTRAGEKVPGASPE